MTGLGVALGLVSAAVFGLASVVQATAVRGFDAADTLSAFLVRAVRDLRTWLVVAGYLLGFVLHAAAIWLLPLYLAQATIAMQLPVTAVLGRRIEGPLGRARWVAVGVVTAGLVLLTLGSGGAGDARASWGAAALAWGSAAALAVVGLAAPRLGGAPLGAVAGLGYAGSALAVRGVGSPVDAPAVVTALAVPAFSVLAFWLYSLAMTRARVASASATLIVVQTFVPAAVGVIWLGDGVRPGWWPVVLAGLVLATAAAASLGRAERGPSEVAAAG